MTFLNAFLLWSGAALAAGPILIHLLNRRRFRILDWAAMDFLLESGRRNRRRIRLEEWLLLALRVLVILLMGAALARPFVGERSLAVVLGMKARADHVIILDDSYSMAQRLGTETIFDRARGALEKIAERIAPEDNFTLLLVSQSEPVFATGHLTDLDGFKNDLRTLAPSDFATDLITPLERAREIFAESKNSEKRLYLLSDFRQRDWDFAAPSSSASSPANPNGGQRIKAILEKISAAATGQPRVRILLLDFAPDDAANLSVTQFASRDKHVVKGMRAQFQAAVINRGSLPAKNVPVNFTVGGQQFPARVIESLAPGESVALQFSYVFADGGPQNMTVSLPADTLAPDNAAHLALDARPAVPVLIVNGAPDDLPYVNEPDYFVAALDPAGKGLSGYRPQVITESALVNAKFADYDIVVLANLARLPKTKLDELEAYVKAGGGLAIFLGDKIDRDFYNNEFFNEGEGLQPLHLEPPRGDPLDHDQFVRLKVAAANHPVMSIFGGIGGAMLERVHVHSYYAAQIADSAGVKAIATYTDRDESPALIEKMFGDGKVLIFTSTLSAKWSDWPRSPSYPIVVNELVAHLARPPVQAKSARVGEPIRREVETEFLDAAITIKTPVAGQEAAKLAPKAEGEKFLASFDKADRAGIYAVELKSPAKTARDFFARNVEPGEGSLMKMDAATLTQRLQDLPVQYIANLAATELALSDEAKGKEFWRYILFALLGLLVVESVLALRFGHYSR